MVRLLGEGSIYQRSNGKWVAEQYYLTPENERRKKSFSSVKSKREVKQKLLAFQRECEGASFGVESDVTTIEEYMTQWLENIKKIQVAKNSYGRLLQVARYQVFPRIGHLNFFTVSVKTIQAELINDLLESTYIVGSGNSLRERGYSYSTIKKSYELVRAVYKYAARVRDIPYDLMETLVLPSKKMFTDKVARSLSPEEVDSFISACSNDANYGNAGLILLWTGLRIGELSALTYGKIDFEKRLIRVNSNVIEYIDGNGKDCHEKVNYTKTFHGDRFVPLSSNMQKLIARMGDLQPEDFLVLNPKSGAMNTPRNIRRGLNRIFEAADIKNATPHTLRHTYATRLFNKGVDVKIVSEILGHASVDITYNTYIHTLQEQKMEQALKGDYFN